MWCSILGCIVTLILSLTSAPLAAEAQPGAHMPRIGVLRRAAYQAADLEAFRQGLRAHTTDALVEGVVGRQFDAAFVAGRAESMGLKALAAFDEKSVLAAPRAHPAIGWAQDVQIDTIISFPAGCAYRRLLQSWLAAGDVVPEKVLELSSSHAMVAGVAAGTGRALVPRSVPEAVRMRDSLALYPVPAAQGHLTTYLVWRQDATSSALRALQAEVRAAKAAGTRSGLNRGCGRTRPPGR